MKKNESLELETYDCESAKKSVTYHHGNLKEELLNQSLYIIQTQSVDAVTLQALGNKLGTSRSAIYRHFSSKQDLLQNVITYGFDMFEKIISPIFMMKDKRVDERLYLMGETYINFAIENPNLYRMLFGEKYQDLREESCDITNEEQAQGFYALVNLLIEGHENNIFKVEDPILQAQAIHALVHGISSLYIDGHMHTQENIKELYDISFRTITTGLLVK